MKILAFHAHSGDPLSFLIKAITRSQYCHGAILVDDTQWRAIIAKECKLDLNTPVNGVSKHLIIEAYWPKVRTRFLREDELSEIDVFDVPALTTAQEISSIKWLISQLGVSYEGADLFRFGYG